MYRVVIFAIAIVFGCGLFAPAFADKRCGEGACYDFKTKTCVKSKVCTVSK